MPRRIAPLLWTSLALLSAVLAPAPAGAVFLSGNLAPVPGPGGCVRDPGRTDPAGLACAQPVDALRAPSALAVSPDGRDVYVASAESGAVVVLARRPGGGLAPPRRPSRADCVQQTGGFNCSASSPGLAGADAVVVSPDGRNVYVGSADAGAVVGFARSPHGLLSPLRPARAKAKAKGKGKNPPGANCIHGHEVVPGAAGSCSGKFAALQRVDALAISRDGKFLYALSSGNLPGEDTLVSLRRAADGTLRPIADCVSSHGGGRPLCPRRATGMRGASAIALSPDGRFAYVASALSSAVAGFQRSRLTAAMVPLRGGGACVAQPTLSPAADFPSCPAIANGLRSARSVAVSPDGRYVYVAGFEPGSLAVLGREPVRGGLIPQAAAPAACLQAGLGLGCNSSLALLRGASAVTVAGAGDRVIVASQAGDSALEIPLTAGMPNLPLAPIAHFSPLGGPQAIALSPDGRNVYLASPADDEVAALTG